MNLHDNSSRRASAGYWVFSLLAGCAVVALAWCNRLTFPFPWNDEARFFLPAWTFANTRSIDPSILNAPIGIYWVPDGFYLWIGSVLAIFGHGMTVARVACNLVVGASVSIFALSFKRITGTLSMGIACTLLLIAPPVIFAANMVRMESVLCLLLALATFLHMRRSPIAAAVLLVSSVLFHPALALAAVAYAVAVWVWPNHADRRWKLSSLRAAEAILLLALFVALSAEAWRILHHLHIFQQHMAYQTARKASRDYWMLWRKPQGVLLTGELGLLAVACGTSIRKLLCADHQILPVLAVAIAAQLYAVIGGEAMYDVYSLSVGPALFLAASYRVYSQHEGMGARGCAVPSGSQPLN